MLADIQTLCKTYAAVTHKSTWNAVGTTHSFWRN